MRLGWDEIKRRARAFSEDWKDAHYEKGETQSFYNDFFDIFGVKRRTVASYERRVESIDANRRGFIDLFWPGVLIVEQKSGGRDLLKAQGQAFEYFDWLADKDKPRFILTCDFQRWRLLDLDSNTETRFTLAELHKHIEAFAFVLGRQRSFETQADVTIKAAELMGKLHDALEANNYTGHDLEQLLVRLLFCMFADDTGIFQPKDIFLQLIDADTRDDGSDTGRVIMELFDVLDTPEGQRQTGLSAELNAFPYINGQLFAGRLRTPVFDAKMRAMLLDACRHNWSAVSPAIFGSLFQSVMSADKRRKIGAHYTSEANILKVIGPLFVDDLRAELDGIIARRTGRQAALLEFQHKLARLTFLDPACGCGNFLVIAYREIRRLELACLKALYPTQQIDAVLLSRVTVEQFYGIEVEEFPARIAEVAMWMADHLANNEYNEAFQGNSARIPLKDSPHILNADALDTDWSSFIAPDKLHYIMGNPPFIGQSHQSAIQRQQMSRVLNAPDGRAGSIDYVCAWFVKAAAFIAANHHIRMAFVATNSICQGEQVAQLWPLLFDRYGLEIAFAHRTFSWGSEARGKAHVHVVIIGLAHRSLERLAKRLFSYPDIFRDPVETEVRGVSPYLTDAANLANRHLIVRERSTPLSDVPAIIYGSKPVDGGNLILEPTDRSELLKSEPALRKYVRPLIGAQEFLHAEARYCLWLVDADPTAIKSSAALKRRIAAVRKFRLASKKLSTQKSADRPTEFAEIRQPTSSYVVIPMHTSENRKYVPFGFYDKKSIVHNSCTCIPDADLFDFGIISSLMHMEWLRHVGGRLESRYRYANTLVYNTFPWPDATPAQRAKIEALAQAVLDARANHPTASLADLYDPDTMPADLRRAHHALDLAVDRLYRPAPFASDRDRVEHLFGRYEALVNPLATAGVKANKRVARKAERDV